MKYFVKFVILAIFAIFVAHSFHIARKILVIFAIFAIIADISGPFLGSSFSKSRILLNLLFLRCLSWVFLVNMKNPCYFCNFWDICRHFGALHYETKICENPMKIT